MSLEEGGREKADGEAGGAQTRKTVLPLEIGQSKRKMATMPSDKWVRWGNYFKNFIWFVSLSTQTEPQGVKVSFWTGVPVWSSSPLEDTHYLGEGLPSALLAQRVSVSHKGIWLSFRWSLIYPKQRAFFSALSSWQVVNCPRLGLFTIIGIAGDEIWEAMGILSPAGNYLPTSSDLPANSDAIYCYWICLLADKLFLSIALSHFIFSKNYHRRTLSKAEEYVCI